MNRILGILGIVLVLYGAVMLSDSNARSLRNHQNLANRTGLRGVMTLGAGIVIIAGGIDLSMGSVVGLGAVVLALLLERGVWPWLAVGIVLAGSPLIGLFHGVLITKLRLQPFIVTLCGLFIYRGIACWATWTGGGSARTVGIGGVPGLESLQQFGAGEVFGIPSAFLIFLVLCLVFTVFLHLSVYGRYLYAIGFNEQAAKYAGVATDNYKILAYVLCSLLAGLTGVMFMLYLDSANPSSFGQSFELYAIAGAVLGGCSLRGGEGMVAGMLLGTMVLPLLSNLCQFARIPSDVEYTVIGGALLLGTIADELIKRVKRRKATS
jgi:ribose transport system permease protein